MNFRILNSSNYEIKEINFDNYVLLKKFEKDIWGMKKFICKRSKTIDKDKTHINSIL